MTWFSGNLGFDLIWIFTLGAALWFLYTAVFWTLELLPLGDDRRVTLSRVKPLVGLLGALVFALFSAHALFSRYEGILPIALLLVLVGFFLGSRNLVRDFFSGVALRAEQSCRIGDHIRVGTTHGRVTDLGPRAIALVTPEGDRALIPYSQATLQHIIRTRATESSASRTFLIESLGDQSFSAICSTIEKAALFQHWASVARPPEVQAKPGGQIEVTVFALAQTHTADVELAVRKAVERSSTT